MLDLVKDGLSFEEVIKLAKLLEQHKVDIINTGIGWHEARIPTIATMVPRAAFTWITERIKKEVNLPVVATNRINNPIDANEIIKSGQADMVSMARPFLADPEIVNKSKEGKAHLINTCIACNQACLDHIFKNKIASCLVNPKACHETEFDKIKKTTTKNLAVIGSGPAGLSFAIEAAKRGHKVTIFEKNAEIGGQFNLASKIPGKEEFNETVRFFKESIKEYGINLKLNTLVDRESLNSMNYDEYIFSSGIKPRIPKIEGLNHSKVISYPELISGKKVAGNSVAIIGAGGIGFDVCEYLSYTDLNKSSSLHLDDFLNEWGIDVEFKQRGALKERTPSHNSRKLTLLQRKNDKFGKNLGKTTGWIHRQTLKDKSVELIGGVEYKKIDDEGLHIHVNQQDRILKVDSIIICAGQVSENELYHKAREILKEPCHLIGGALLAQEIDAKRAIDQGVRLANSI